MVEFKDVVSSKQIIVGCTVLATFLATSVALWLQQRKRNIKVPENWQPVGKVEKLILYPLKSGAGIDLSDAECTPLGMKEIKKQGKFLFQDRVFMVYNCSTGVFVNAKSQKKLFTIHLKSVDEKNVTFSNSEFGEITFIVPDSNGKKAQCRMGKEEFELVDCGDQIAVWLAKFFGDTENTLRLGYYVSGAVARRKPSNEVWKKFTKVYDKMSKEYLGAYSDIASYMILSQDSVEELNSRLEPENQISERNFRPNILVSASAGAFSEDSWDWIKIGNSVIMRSFKPCTRCTVITMNPTTGTLNPKVEPLKTLQKYRLATDPKVKQFEKSSPLFGQYFGLHAVGSVSVGDTVYIGSN